LARIALGLQDCLYLGNLDAKRDWGHARDYVEVQWMMLQQPQPEDFVIASGIQFSVRDFVNAAAGELGIEIEWHGQGVKETGVVSTVRENHGSGIKPGNTIVRVDPRYFRPAEVETLLGDAGKARAKLGWSPRVNFKELVAEMIKEDFKAARRDDLVKRHGYATYDYHE
jgi:GDPmannose 4,6-dehydratase